MIGYNFYFRKEETDQESNEIRQKCEEYVVNINNLQNQVLFIKTPHRRVNLNNNKNERTIRFLF
jgi:hypothetical protein